MTGRYHSFLFALLIFSIPINADVHFFLKDHIGGSIGLAISAADLLLLMLVAGHLIEGWRGRNCKFSINLKLTWPVVSYLVLCGLSVVFAQDVTLGLFEFVRILKAIVIFYYVLNFSNRLLTLRQIAIILVIGLGLESILGLVQATSETVLGLAVLGEEPVLRSLVGATAVSRVGGTIGHPNEFATYLVLILPISYALFIDHSSVLKRLGFLCIFICANVVLVLTMSRGGWVSFSCAMVFFMVSNIVLNTGRSFSRLYLGSGLVIVALVIFLGWSGIHTRLYGDDYGAAYSRVTMIKVAGAMTRDHLLTGVGLNNYTKGASRYAPAESFEGEYPVHSMFPLIFAETGVASGLSFILFILLVIKRGINKMRLSTPAERLLYTGITSGFVGFIIAAQVGTALLWNPLLLLFWIVSGILIGNHLPLIHKRQ